MNSPKPLRRVALIFRSALYVGPALARRLAQCGHDLVLHAPSDELLSDLQRFPVEVEVVSSDDVPLQGEGSDATAAGCSRMVEHTLERFGRLDAAALFPPSGGVHGFVTGPLLEAPLEHVRSMSGFLETTYHVLRAVIPAMGERGGQILVFTSDAGVRPEAGWSLYGAGRAGQSFLVRAAALEHAGDGICINALGSKNAVFEGFPGAPSGSVTDGTVVYGDWSKPLVAETPLGRLGTMEELAAFAAVLLDGTNRFQTAQYFSYSGGWNSA